MRKVKGLPHEGLHDGLPTEAGPTDQDVEGHARLPGTGGDQLGQRLPGTGGDFRRPSGGGEAVEDDDVEGHARLPGTGGDFRRPSGGGEAADDTED